MTTHQASGLGDINACRRRAQGKQIREGGNSSGGDKCVWTKNKRGEMTTGDLACSTVEGNDNMWERRGGGEERRR